MSRTIRLVRAVMITSLSLIGLASLPLDAQSTGIAGVVKGAAGQPVTGALVKVKSDALGIAFTVVSQGQGRYSTPNLLPGKYEVQSFGGTEQSAPTGPVDVGTGQQAKLDLVLNVPLQVPALQKRLTDDDYAKLMPESDPAEIKTIIVSDCRECHAMQWTVSARKSRDQWQETVRRMYHDLLGRRMPLWFELKDDEFVGGKRFALVMDYLAKNYGPQVPPDPRAFGPWVAPGSAPHPNRNLPAALLSGAAAKYIGMEFSLPADAMPSDIAADSQGIAWVSERNSGMLGRFDPNSQTYARIAIPPGKDAKLQLHAVAVDPQDHVWFADDGPNARILQYDPKSKDFTSYPIPAYRWAVPDSGQARIATLRFFNGNVWATRLNAQRILKLDPSTKKITEYPLPRGSSPFGLAVNGPDAVWFSAEVGDVVVKLNPISGELAPHDVPAERSDLRGMAADAEGNLWTAATETGKLIKVDGHSGKATEFAPPTADSGPYSVDVDTKRNLVWFNEIFSDRIGRFDPAKNSFVEFPQPSADLDVRRIEIDRSHPNRIWWAGTRAGKIGYLDVTE